MALPDLGTPHVWSRDEARPGLAAKEMLATGQWAVPHIGGRIDTQKPPLFSWAVLLVSPRGVSEWSLRLPSAVAAAGTVTLTYLLGARLIAPAVGTIAAAILASSFTFYQWSRTGRMEMLLAFFITLGCWSLVRWLETGRRTDSALLGLWMGMGVLTKGPIALAPAMVGAIVLVSLRPRPSRLASHVGLCALTTSSVVLVWLGIGWLTSDDFATYIWMLGPMFVSELTELHPRSTFALIAGGFLPWTLTLPAVAALLTRSWRSVWRALVVPVAWAATIAVIFSTVLHPRDAYFLPLYPPLALLVGWAWQVATGRWLRRLFGPLAIAGLGVALVTAAVLLTGLSVEIPFGDGGIPLQMSPGTLAAALTLSVTMILGYAFLRAEKGLLVAVSTAVGILMFFILADTGIRTPALNRTFPTSEAAARLAASLPTAATVAYVDHRHFTALAFYLPQRSIQLPTLEAAESLVGRRDVFLLFLETDRPLTRDGQPIPFDVIDRVRFDGIGYVLAAFSGS